MPRSKPKKLNLKKYQKIIKLASVSFALFTLAVVGQQYFAFNSINPNPPKILGKTTRYISVGKHFLTPVNAASNLDLTIASAQLADEIVIGEQKVTAVGDKNFLVITATLTNHTPHTISTNLRDTIKLNAGITKEPVTAQFHNDPLTVASDTNLTTTLGFVLGQPSDNLTLLIKTEPAVFTALPLSRE